MRQIISRQNYTLALGPALIAWVLMRGPISIFLQSNFAGCGNWMRAADYIIACILVSIFLVATAIKNGAFYSNIKHWLYVSCGLIIPISISAVVNSQPLLQALGLGLFEFSWLLISLAAIIVLKKRKPVSPGINGLVIYGAAIIAGFSLLLYFLGVNDDVDSALGFGQCGTTDVLLVGGDDGWIRSRGLARNPNEFGALMLVPFAFSLAKINLKKINPTSTLPAILIGSSVAVTFSRSAWIGAAFLACTILGPKLLSKFSSRQMIASSMLAATSLLIFGRLLIGSSFGREIVLHQSDIDEKGSTSIRTESTKLALDKISQKPLFGHGVGSSGATGRALDIDGNIESESYPLNLLIEVGLVGATGFTFMVAYAASKLNKTSRLALLAVLISNIFAPTLVNPSVQMALIALFIIGGSTIRDDGKPRLTKSPGIGR